MLSNILRLRSDGPSPVECRVPAESVLPVLQPARAPPAAPLVLGDMMIGRLLPDGLDVLRRASAADDRTVMLLFLTHAYRIVLDDGIAVDCGPGDIVAIPVRRLPDGLHELPHPCIMLLASYRVLVTAMPGRSPITVLRHSIAVEAVRRYVEALLMLGSDAFSLPQAALAGRALRELLAASLAPVAAAAPRWPRREEALLDRLVDHIDRHLADDVGVQSLCERLGCSRSALYRAAVPVGGLVELVTRRRLAAVYAMLLRPEERRSIADIARAHGFPDSSQFSRRFRRIFGVSAGSVRARPSGPAPAPAYNPRLRLDRSDDGPVPATSWIEDRR